jgi:ribosomal protein L7/L12
VSTEDILNLQLRVAELERRLAALDGLAPGQGPPPEAGSDPAIQQLVVAGDLIGAIKRYREMTGAGLAEAKHAIDAMNRNVRL